MRHYSRRLLLSALLLGACGKKRVKIASLPPLSTEAGQVIQRGLASWYGHPYHGRRTASGEIYDMEAMVAAHRTLPFQTWVRVRNLANNKTTDVRITDRGPFVGSRIIDLSHAAAQRIDLIGPGVAEVELRVISAPAPVASGVFGVQVGAFQDHSNASRNLETMRRAYGSAVIVERPGEPVLYRVLAGSEPSPEAAEILARRVRTEQKLPQAFVVRLDP